MRPGGEAERSRAAKLERSSEAQGVISSPSGLERPFRAPVKPSGFERAPAIARAVSSSQFGRPGETERARASNSSTPAMPNGPKQQIRAPQRSRADSSTLAKPSKAEPLTDLEGPAAAFQTEAFAKIFLYMGPPRTVSEAHKLFLEPTGAVPGAHKHCSGVHKRCSGAQAAVWSPEAMFCSPQPLFWSHKYCFESPQALF